ncbi:MAG: arginine--tRNA ligase [Bacteroidales bacterium]
MKIEEKIAREVATIIEEQFGQPVPASGVSIQKTRKEFTGDFTIVVFPYVKVARRSPEQTAQLLGEALKERVEEVLDFNVIKGFLNLVLAPGFWLDFLKAQMGNPTFGFRNHHEEAPVVVEYSSPNTNKPLHLGHIRNNLLGYSVARLLEASGQKVVKVNLVNDRGIHICKSMLAWMRYGNGQTPESSGMKGDKLVGDYYVRFETELRAQVKDMMARLGVDEETARKTAPLMLDAQQLLRKWEQRDPDTLKVWNLMNGWVYEGFDVTYKRLGVDFDKIYYESQTYLLGKEIVQEGLEKGAFGRKEDGSVWVDLSQYNLDEKLLLRSDGTSVYMTQDLGTAQLRYDDFQPQKMVYVVGNEQNYHFDVLAKVLKKLDKPFAGHVYHLSYGMVELPEGKMKSREGTVVDADDLMDEMVETARRTTEELGKTRDFDEARKKELYEMIGLGALKYFILKVDPKKNMLFNPAESIDFNGHTGPFIQYTHARIRSMLRTAGQQRLEGIVLQMKPQEMFPREVSLLKVLYDFPRIVEEAAAELSPAQIANYAFELSKEYNQFYHEHSVLNEPEARISDFRLKLSELTSQTIRNAMGLLGIQVPEKM